MFGIRKLWKEKSRWKKYPCMYGIWREMTDRSRGDRCAGDSVRVGRTRGLNCKIGNRNARGELVERCRREIRANGNSVVTLARLKYAIRSDTILRSPPPFPGPLIEFSLAAFAVVVKEPATEFIVRKLVNFDTLHQPYIVHCVYSIRRRISQIPPPISPRWSSRSLRSRLLRSDFSRFW